MRTMMKKPLDTLIEVYGSFEAIRDVCGLKDAGRVRRWGYPPERDGLDGNVPKKHHLTILKDAHSKGLQLAIKDLDPELAALGADQ